jgi:putative transposase
LQRFVVLFFLELSTRRVEVAGIASMPNGLWMTQIARNLTDGVDGFFTGKRYLIHDRDPLYTNEFLDMLADVRVQSVKLPRRSPNLNAYAERFVRTIKESCLDRMIWFGEDALRRGISEKSPGTRQSSDHSKQTTAATAGMVQKRERLGGMLNYYFREAA